jgi:vacuolar-type H+-ATPase subunit C/Vma6
MARAPDLVQLAAALGDAYGAESGFGAGPSAEQLEVAVRRVAARHLHVVTRWAGKRARYLAPLFLDEDRRSVRALIRGAAAGTSPHERLASLVPTAALPERALQELSRRPTVADVVALLVLWGHPFGAPLFGEARGPRPDLLRLDLLLNAEAARLAARAVRRAPLGNAARRDLRLWVQATVDLENACSALQLAAQRSSTDPAQFFVSGGRAIDRTTFARAAAATSAAAAAALLARALRGTALDSVLGAATRRPIEDAALVAELRRTRDAARKSPLGAAPIIAFFTRLRAEVRDLRFIIWRAALGAPPAAPDALVTRA